MKIKAVGLLSGGLDSTLAAKIMLEQGIEVHAINFTSPFCTCTPRSASCASVITSVRQLGNIPLKRFFLGNEYLALVKNPKFGHGRGMNPCIDCRIEKIRKAAQYMKEINASFLFTGEVLGQRPMSQTRKALEIIDRETGLGNLILRPLSAGHFKPTIPEINGWVNRENLLSIEGRSRKEQIKIAKDKDITDYPCPAGGCLLTDKNFAERLKDYFNYTEKIVHKDIQLLKIGRHFRLKNSDKIIVARDEAECMTLEKTCRNLDYLLIPTNFPGPTVVLQGENRPAAIEKLLEYTHAPIPDNACIHCIHRGEGVDLERSEWKEKS